jgi:hypothetical protein
MDILKMLAELRDERAQIEQAILAIEQLASGRGEAGPSAGMDVRSNHSKTAWPASGEPEQAQGRGTRVAGRKAPWAKRGSFVDTSVDRDSAAGMS